MSYSVFLWKVKLGNKLTVWQFVSFIACFYLFCTVANLSMPSSLPSIDEWNMVEYRQGWTCCSSFQDDSSFCYRRCLCIVLKGSIKGPVLIYRHLDVKPSECVDKCREEGQKEGGQQGGRTIDGERRITIQNSTTNAGYFTLSIIY